MYITYTITLLYLELGGECVDNVDVSTSDRMLGGWREVLYQKLRQNYRGSAALMTKLNINIIPWPNFRRGARCWALGFLRGWRGGEQETCYRLLTFQSRDPTSAWTGTSLLSWGHRNLYGDNFYHYQEIQQSKSKIFQLGSGSNQHIQSQLDISTVAIWPCISV